MKLRELISETNYTFQGDANFTEPLRSTDTIKVYHNFNNNNDAVIAVKYGISGAQYAKRLYSYESDNNPKGLFVSPNFKTIDSFGNTIIEFDAMVKDLEPPVWPGGSFTSYGEYSKYWGSGKEGVRKRRAAQKNLKSSYVTDPTMPEPIKHSDNPHLAHMLSDTHESQALFTGHLEPSNITRIFIRKNNTIHSWEEISKEEFLNKVDSTSDEERPEHTRFFSPSAPFDPIVFVNKIQKNYNFTGGSVEKLLSNIWKFYIKPYKEQKGEHFKHTMSNYLWPKQMPDAYKWFLKNIEPMEKNENT